MVPESYAVGMDELMDTEQGHGLNHDTKNLDVKVRVGWVKGLNRLYFLYEGFDNYWDFAASGPAQRHLRSGRRRRSLRRSAHRHLPPRCLDARSGRAALGARPESAARRRAFRLSRRARAELPHLHAAGRQGLDDGVGLRAVHERPSLRERRLRLQLQARSVGKTGARVLDHAIRLCRRATGRSARSNRS